MAKKVDDVKRLARTVIQEYHKSGNNVNILAERLSIPNRLAEKLISSLEGEGLKYTPDQARSILESFERREFLSGPGEMPVNREKIRQGYLTRDYQLIPGASLPGTRGNSYQAIVRGKMRGQERFVTSLWYGTPEEAVSEIEALSRQYYGKWEADEDNSFELREFEPLDDTDD